MDQDELLTKAWDHEVAAIRYEKLHDVAQEVAHVASWVALWFALQGALASRRRRKAERQAQAAADARELAAKVDEAFRDAEAS